jgi:hypothetical protein
MRVDFFFSDDLFGSSKRPMPNKINIPKIPTVTIGELLSGGLRLTGQ